MTEAYDGRQVVGMDLHRRRSVLVRLTEDGRNLETVRTWSADLTGRRPNSVLRNLRLDKTAWAWTVAFQACPLRVSTSDRFRPQASGPVGDGVQVVADPGARGIPRACGGRDR